MADEALTVGPYQSTVADLRALNWAVQRSPGYWVFTVLTPVFVMAGFAGIALFIRGIVMPQWFGFMPFEEHEDFVVLPAILLAALYQIALPRLLIRRSVHEQRRRARNTTMTISAKGVEVTSETTHSQSTWAAFERIAETRKHIFFFITRTQAYIVPKRAFATPEVATAFVDAARGWHSQVARV